MATDVKPPCGIAYVTMLFVGDASVKVGGIHRLIKYNLSCSVAITALRVALGYRGGLAPFTEHASWQKVPLDAQLHRAQKPYHPLPLMPVGRWMFVRIRRFPSACCFWNRLPVRTLTQSAWAGAAPTDTGAPPVCFARYSRHFQQKGFLWEPQDSPRSLPCWLAGFLSPALQQVPSKLWHPSRSTSE